MRQFIFITILFFISTILQSTAFGDWQYTKWGMTGEQIVEASGGKARLLKPSEVRGKSGKDWYAIAIGTYSIGPFDFEVSFRAVKGSKTLNEVRLILTDSKQYSKLREVLTAKYGLGKEFNHGKSVRTNDIIWQAGTDTVFLRHMRISLAFTTHVHVIYREQVVIDWNDLIK